MNRVSRMYLYIIVIALMACSAWAQEAVKSVFTGGDPGEGLAWNLQGSVYAISFGQAPGVPGTVQGLKFTGINANGTFGGVTVAGVAQWLNGWNCSPSYGTSASDDALELIVRTFAYKIGDMTMDFAVEPGVTYNVMFLYPYIQENNHKASLYGENQLLVTIDNKPADGGQTNGYLYKYTYTATDNVLNIKVNATSKHGTLPAIVIEKKYRGEAVMVSPANGARNIPVDTVLQWERGGDPNGPETKAYNLYLDDDRLFAGVTPIRINVNGGTMNYGPLALATDTVYYWRVDELLDVSKPNDPNYIIPGYAWSFETVPSIPVVLSVDQYGSAAAGGTAQVSCEFESKMSQPRVTWKKVTGEGDVTVNEAAGYAVALTGDEAGNYLATLAKADLVMADEAFYYALVENASTDKTGVPIRVDFALGLHRQVAHWTLNQSDYTGGAHRNVAGEAPDATATGASFVEGADGTAGGALNIVAASGSGYAQAGTYHPTAYTGQLTVTAWVKLTDHNNQFQGIIAKRNNWAAQDMVWQLQKSNDTTGNVYLNSAAGGAVGYVPSVTPGQWAFVAAIYDGQQAHFYLNGVRVASGPMTLGNGGTAPLLIGATQLVAAGGASDLFNGAIDDVQLFNYAVENTLIAALYTGFTGTSVCIADNYLAGLDQSGPEGAADCRIDLYDFAVFANNWLDCVIYPDCYAITE